MKTLIVGVLLTAGAIVMFVVATKRSTDITIAAQKAFSREMSLAGDPQKRQINSGPSLDQETGKSQDVGESQETDDESDVSSEDVFSPQAFSDHVRNLQQSLPKDDDFFIVIQKPFVVIGNESAATVQQRSTQTVQWAVERLQKTYFKKPPKHIINVWLFKDKTTYEKNCQTLFNRKPTTPYGYYSSTDRALVMNISTGGGTLVHEIVHPFIESNFPACPSWFNEGLASLYEQSASDNDQIVGLTNWRLRGLQLAIADQTVPRFATLCKTTTDEFYRQDPGTHYAQARYLCYYLQEKKLLQKFYQQFTKNVAQDPSGYQTLQQVLETSDMDAFQKQWEAFVMDLRFPPVR